MKKCRSMDAIAQIKNHLVNLLFELVYFTRGLDRDQLGKVTVGRSISDVAKGPHLRREVHSHSVDVRGDLLPATPNACDIGLYAHLAINAYILCHSLHFIGE